MLYRYLILSVKSVDGCQEMTLYIKVYIYRPSVPVHSCSVITLSRRAQLPFRLIRHVLTPLFISPAR